MAPNRTLSSPSPPGTEPGTILFETDRLIVRRYLLADAPALAKAGNYVQIWDNMTDRFPSPYTPANAAEFIRRTTLEPPAEGHSPEYPTGTAIFTKQPGGGAGQLIGSMGIRPGSDITYRTWDLGYFVTPGAWGQGYATEAVGAFVRWLFATWPALVRVQASTFEFNAPSGRVLEKCGFVREGLRKDSAEKSGKVVGEILYGLVRRDLEK